MPLLMIACDIVMAEKTTTTCAQGVEHTRFACGVELPETSLVRKSNNAGRSNHVLDKLPSLISEDQKLEMGAIFIS